MSDQDEIGRLVSFIILIVRIGALAITAIVAVALFSTWQNMSDLRTEVSGSMEKLDSNAKEGLDNYKYSVENFRIYAEKILSQTLENTNNQIDLIAQNARQLAIVAANERIDEAFKEPKLKGMIESAGTEAISQFISYRLDSMVNDANNVISNQLQLVPDLILGVDLIRTGDRHAYEYLDSLTQVTSDSLIKIITVKILAEKKQQYKSFAEDLLVKIDSAIEEGYLMISFGGYEVYYEDDLRRSADTISFLNSIIQKIDYSNEIEYNALQIGALKRYHIADQRIDEELISLTMGCYDLNLSSLLFNLLNYRGIRIDLFDFDGLRNRLFR